MAQLDAGIILQGRQPDTMGHYMRGMGVRQAEDEMRQKNALRALMQQHGPGLVQGDQNAINALAGVDPSAALGIMGQRQGMEAQQLNMQATQQRMGILSAQEERAIADHKAKIGAQQAAAEAAAIEGAVKQGMMVQSPQQWDAMMAQTAPELVGQFANREALATKFMTVAEILKRMEPPTPQSSQGKFYADQAAGLVPGDVQYKGAGTTVNVGGQNPMPGLGKLPAGYTYLYNEDGTVKTDERGAPISTAVPGTKEANAADATSRKIELNIADYNRKFDIVDSNLAKAIQAVEEKGRLVSGYGSMFAGLPESAARDFQATLDTVKANLGFEELQGMRDASPTGGALGQVSEREIAFLQAIQGNLDAAQSPAQLLEVLKEIRERRAGFKAEREKIMAGGQSARGDIPMVGKSSVPDFSAMTDEQLDAWIAENGQ